MVSLLTKPTTAQCTAQWLPGDGFDMRGTAAPNTDLVRALARLPNGDIVAGGEFSVAGGVPVANIARWDGSSWQPLGSGIQGGPVVALAALPNGDVVVGGGFTTAGGAAATQIAIWNGTSWSSPGGGVSGATPWVSSLAVTATGGFIAGGSFSQAGAIAADNIAEWNGSTWTALPGLARPVGGVCVLPGGNVVAGTDFLTGLIYPPTASRVMQWNGSAWTSIGDSSGGGAPRVASLANGDVIAWPLNDIAGAQINGIARWNGAAWAPVGPVNAQLPQLEAVTELSNGDIVAAGSFASLGGVYASQIARWNGTAWAQLGGIALNPISGVTAVLPLPNEEVVAGGRFVRAGAIEAHNIVRWACPAGIAASATFGAGCYWRSQSFYESFLAPDSFDLSWSTLRLTLTSTGYDALHIPGPPAFYVPTTPPLTLGDDDLTGVALPFSLPYPPNPNNPFQTSPTSMIWVASNGRVFLEPTGLTQSPYYGNNQMLLDWGSSHAPMFGDHDPASGTGSGTIHVDFVGQAIYVTWLGVQQWNAPGVTSTFQVAFASNGDIEYRYQACTHVAEQLTGWSASEIFPNTEPDPTSRDLTAGGPFGTTLLPFRLPPRLTADQRPWPGSTVTLTTSQLDAATTMGLTIAGFTQFQAGIELSSLGMPECRLFTTFDLLFWFTPSNQAGNVTIPIPTQTNLIGVSAYLQSAAWEATANPGGITSSNGLTLTIGNP